MFRKWFAVLVVAVLVVSLTVPALASRNDDLYQRVEAHKQPLLDDLATFVNIDSGSGYEPGLKQYQGILIDKLREMGAEVQTFEVKKPQAGYNIAATFRGTGKGSLLLVAHADTVWTAGK